MAGKPWEIQYADTPAANNAPAQLPSGKKPWDVQYADAPAPAAPTPALATPAAPELSFGQRLGRQVGLIARKGAEFTGGAVTGAADLAMAPYNMALEHFGTPEAQKYKVHVTDTFNKGLSELGLPSPSTPLEKLVSTTTDIAPIVGATGIGAARMVAPAVKKLAARYAGKEAEDLAREAGGAIRQEVGQAATGHEAAAMRAEQTARRAEQAAESAATQRTKLEAQIAAAPNNPPSLHETGSSLREVIDKSLTEASARRTSEGNRLFSAAEQAAKTKEAAGQFVNTAAAKKPITELLKNIEDIPQLSSKVQGMADALNTKNMTFARAEVIRRYLNDIGYGADLEGYPGIARRAAREAATALDKSMADYTPEFAKYKSEYKRLSEPLETMTTRLGKAILDTEGGIKSDAYSKIAAEDLPGRVFGKKDSVDILVDALAGGKNATPEARAHAEAIAQNLAYKYFSEVARPMTPEAALAHATSPKTRSVLEAMPQVAGKLTGKAERGIAAGEKVKALAETEKAATKTAEVARKQAMDFRKTAIDIRAQIFHADTLSEQKSSESVREALTAYQQALNKARKVGAIDDTTYKAAINMIDRVHTSTEKMNAAKTIVRRLLYFSAGVGGLGVGSHVLHQYGQAQ